MQAWRNSVDPDQTLQWNSVDPDQTLQESDQSLHSLQLNRQFTHITERGHVEEKYKVKSEGCEYLV